MNPFTESTVARPLAEGVCSRFNGAATAMRRRKRRALLGLTLGVLTGLALPAGVHALDVNTATQEQLLGVRGIGPKTAKIIIEERSRAGRYDSLEDLSDRVKGIGPKKAAALQAAGLTAGASLSQPKNPSTPKTRPK
ncbi:ComEA family DNA-binding protein [Pollutimonas harenae]|nr:helix-hairpin-helix domain-containing protein [Pollutimonas harenae]